MSRDQELLDEEIGQPPPTRIDITAVMARQRRWVRLTQAGRVVSGLAATAALVVFAATLSSVAGTTTAIGGAHPTTTHPTPPTTSSGPTPREQEAARLTAELQRQIRVLLPNAQFRPQPEEPYPGENTGLPTSVPMVFSDQGNYFYTSAQVKDSAGTGVIHILTGHLQTKIELGPSVCDDPPPQDVQIPECVVKPGPNGSAIFIISTIRGSYRRHFVEITRADGLSVSVEITNGQIDNASRPTAPLTSKQTQNLAENPAFATTVP